MAEMFSRLSRRSHPGLLQVRHDHSPLESAAAAASYEESAATEGPLLLDAFGRRVLAAVAVFEVRPVPAVVGAIAVPEGRRYACADVPGAAGSLLAVAGFLEYDGEALGRGGILHVPLPKLGQRTPLPLVRRRHGRAREGA